jgi:hypothetical protein
MYTQLRAILTVVMLLGASTAAWAQRGGRTYVGPGLSGGSADPLVVLFFPVILGAFIEPLLLLFLAYLLVVRNPILAVICVIGQFVIFGGQWFFTALQLFPDNKLIFSFVIIVGGVGCYFLTPRVLDYAKEHPWRWPQ